MSVMRSASATGVIFSLRTFAAAMLALYVSYHLDLSRPTRAFITTYHGLSDFTSVLQAEEQRFTIQLDLIASKSTVSQDVIALHKALSDDPVATATQETP